MRVLLFGGSGLLGSDLRASAPADVKIEAPRSAAVDIADPTAVARALDASGADLVVNAAAYTHVDRAESEPDAAHRLNAVAPGHIGRECGRRGIPVVHYSTDYVFGGQGSRPWREEDPVEPLNAYGRSKLAGEVALLESGANALIMRTSWLYGRNGRSFPRTMLERARRREPTHVVEDQVGRPTWTRDLAAITWELVVREATGVVHATASGAPTTWYEIARRVFARAGVPELLSPCGSDEFPAPAARPAWSVLDVERATRLLGRRLPDWEESLTEYIRLIDGEAAG